MHAPAPHSRLGWLDGLRGVATLMILLAHFLPDPAPGEYRTLLTYAHKATQLSFTGVDLFFVISGFLIGGILIDHRDSPQLRRTFYLRRATRIIPLAWLFILIIWFCWHAGLLPETWLRHSTSAAAWWTSLAFVPNWMLAVQPDWAVLGILSPLWSLGIEEQFYLVAPWALQLVRRPEFAALLFIATGLISRVVILSCKPGWAFSVHFLPFCRADALGAGLLAACLVRNPAMVEAMRLRRSWWWALLVISGIGLAVLTQKQVMVGDLLLAGPGYTVIAAFYMTVLLLLATTNYEPARNLCGQPLLRYVGRYSYFIYLFQGLMAVGLGWLWHRLVPEVPPVISGWSRFFLGPLLLFAFAPLCWRFFEQPFIRLGQRFQY